MALAAALGRRGPWPRYARCAPLSLRAAASARPLLRGPLGRTVQLLITAAAPEGAETQPRGRGRPRKVQLAPAGSTPAAEAAVSSATAAAPRGRRPRRLPPPSPLPPSPAPTGSAFEAVWGDTLGLNPQQAAAAARSSTRTWALIPTTAEGLSSAAADGACPSSTAACQCRPRSSTGSAASAGASEAGAGGGGGEDKAYGLEGLREYEGLLEPQRLGRGAVQLMLVEELTSRDAALRGVAGIALAGAYLPSQLDLLRRCGSALQLSTTHHLSPAGGRVTTVFLPAPASPEASPEVVANMRRLAAVLEEPPEQEPQPSSAPPHPKQQRRGRPRAAPAAGQQPETLAELFGPSLQAEALAAAAAAEAQLGLRVYSTPAARAAWHTLLSQMGAASRRPPARVAAVRIDGWLSPAAVRELAAAAEREGLRTAVVSAAETPPLPPLQQQQVQQQKAGRRGAVPSAEVGGPSSSGQGKRGRKRGSGTAGGSSKGISVLVVCRPKAGEPSRVALQAEDFVDSGSFGLRGGRPVPPPVLLPRQQQQGEAGFEEEGRQLPEAAAGEEEEGQQEEDWQLPEAPAAGEQGPHRRRRLFDSRDDPA